MAEVDAAGRSVRDVVAHWHRIVDAGDPSQIAPLLAEDCVFMSPVVFTTQQGRGATALYLAAAMQVFDGTDFEYVATTIDEDRAVLEFTCTLDGTVVHGVDLVDVADGRIVRFTVMVRPLQGLRRLHDRMAAMLDSATGP